MFFSFFSFFYSILFSRFSFHKHFFRFIFLHSLLKTLQTFDLYRPRRNCNTFNTFLVQNISYDFLIERFLSQFLTIVSVLSSSLTKKTNSSIKVMQSKEEINYDSCIFFANRLNSISLQDSHSSICVVCMCGCGWNQFHFSLVVFWFQFAIRVENWLWKTFQLPLIGRGGKSFIYMSKQKHIQGIFPRTFLS